MPCPAPCPGLKPCPPTCPGLYPCPARDGAISGADRASYGRMARVKMGIALILSMLGYYCGFHHYLNILLFWLGNTKEDGWNLIYRV